MDSSPSPSGLPSDYHRLLASLKERIRAARVKALLSVNRELILLYWDLGRQIVERQKGSRWGTKVIEQISRDLRTEFPRMKGLSRQNIYYMSGFFRAWAEAASICSRPVSKTEKRSGKHGDYAIVQQPVGQLPPPPLSDLPWGHNVVLIDSLTHPSDRLWYAKSAIEHGWSRSVLIRQIESRLHLRQGKAQTNFAQTLPAPQATLAQELMKGEYALDFLITSGFREQDIERGIIDNLQKSLLELGKGFAFVSRQHHLQLGGKDLYIDLLFYNIPLARYVAIELKAGAFKPEHAGKMSAYLSALETQKPLDQPPIGLILCKSKNKLIVEYALRDSRRPIGVATYRLTKVLPRELKPGLPTAAELKERLTL